MFDTVLIANRGEIAVRVIRTLRRLGIRAAVVHTPDDTGARHVREADVAVALRGRGGYLDIEQVVRAAVRCGAAAVHPGYGFLAENAEFARAVTAEGLVFVGPPADAIEVMGDKIRAKDTVRASGVPVVPGSVGRDLTDDQLAEAVREIGLPALLKPAAGGGGKGMRLVRTAGELTDAVAGARREALAAFGDATLLVERWIDRPRHIEIQVLADTHGAVIHLGERECSLQRRHQKIVEEAPSPVLTPPMREAMGEAAVNAARACGYTGAGTVEFVVPSADPATFHFLEMNTRLQVEHPVTELVTGLDLVEWQLRVAAGEPLDTRQEDVALRGHAVEARLYAEDPARGFLPTGGRVLLLREPSGEGVRVDSGLDEGGEVGTAYDPMLAKIVAWGPDRDAARRRLRDALARTRVLGVPVNTGFVHRLLADPEVAAGRLDTGLVERRLGALAGAPAGPDVAVAAALAAHRALPRGGGPFSARDGWRVGEPAWTAHRFVLDGGEPVTVRLRVPRGAPPGRYEADVDGTGPREVTAIWNHGTGHGGTGHDGTGHDGTGRGSIGDGGTVDGGTLRLTVDGLTRTLDVARAPDGAWWLADGPDAWRARPHDPVAAADAAGAAGDGVLTAPMPGTVTVVKAAAGDVVTAGATVVVVEAMKMEHAVVAPFAGVITDLRVGPGRAVAMDEILAVVHPGGESA